MRLFKAMDQRERTLRAAGGIAMGTASVLSLAVGYVLGMQGWVLGAIAFGILVLGLTSLLSLLLLTGEEALFKQAADSSAVGEKGHAGQGRQPD